jgi:hypothetical protein
MRSYKAVLGALAATSLIAAPAAAAPGTKDLRADTSVGGLAFGEGGASGFLLVGGIFAALIAGFLLVSKGDNVPSSP